MATPLSTSNPAFIRRLGHKIIGRFVIKQPNFNISNQLDSDASSLQISNRELYRVKASILADLFPDELIIQEKTISLIRKEMLISSTETITVKDIGRVVYINGILFGALEVLGKNTAHDLRIRGISKDKGAKAKKIIEGLILEDQVSSDMPDWIQAEKHRDLLMEAGLDSHEKAEYARRIKS